jgi:hypothetical protein
MPSIFGSRLMRFCLPLMNLDLYPRFRIVISIRMRIRLVFRQREEFELEPLAVWALATVSGNYNRGAVT